MLSVKHNEQETKKAGHIGSTPLLRRNRKIFSLQSSNSFVKDLCDFFAKSQGPKRRKVDNKNKRTFMEQYPWLT